LGNSELHPWNLSPKEAIVVQRELRDRLSLIWDHRKVTTIGGVDISVKEGHARAAIVVFRFPKLVALSSVTAEMPIDFPYIPGLLSFREGPVFLAAWDKLIDKPDLLMFDGQGIAHPRGIGIAAHMGLLIERPSIGVAKSRLYGHYKEPGVDQGEFSHLLHEKDPKRVIGAVLRTRSAVKPLFISPGHLIDVENAIRFVLQCCSGYRLPEPTRWAHRVAGGQELDQ
jgi:deoxyribonuclease V